MSMKTANEDVYFRIKSASSLIAAGVRLGKPEMEQRGRAAYARAITENTILVHSEHFSPADRAELARLLFATPDATSAAAAAPEPTSPDLDQIRSINAPVDMVPLRELPQDQLYDPDNEFEEEEPDIEV